MDTVELEEITLIGISLGRTTTNANGQSGKDCGTLWQKFEKGNYAATIPGKLTDEVIAVYFGYEGDFTKPFSYFIGMKANPTTDLPVGFEKLVISKGRYQKIAAKGKMPDCVANAWREIWASNMSRAYRQDFEVYDERSKGWNNAEVDIFISVI